VSNVIQVHTKFEIFTGKSIDSLLSEVEKFAAKAKVAPKSIGVEYLEEIDCVVMSLGYRDDEPHYPVKLSCVRVGKIEPTADLSELEKAMTEAAAKQQDIICHEIFITDEHDFFMVFMTC